MRLLAAGVVVLIITFPALAGENLRLNAKLDYTKTVRTVLSLQGITWRMASLLVSLRR